MILEKYSMGIGDRFGHQAKAQLQAFIQAKEDGIEVVPVWNKSHREHCIIGTVPSDVRIAGDAAISEKDWTDSHYVDADHINGSNVEAFIDCSDFFTLDVADFIGKPSDPKDVEQFVAKYSKFTAPFTIDGIDGELNVSAEQISEIASKYLYAVKEAGKIYNQIKSVKGEDNFVTEVSMDETDQPQTPIEMLFILAAIADEGIPAQTIAPKFTGRFNKGVDYVGDVAQFEKEFNDDLAVIRFAVKEFSMQANLKLSVHSGSDKFSIYAPISKALKKFDAGLHLKTAGTTWLEEIIGLALAGGEGLQIAKDVYGQAMKKFDELCAPYATVIDIDKNNLPDAETINGWDGGQLASALTHDQSCKEYNPDMRQLLHVGYKVAAQMGDRFTNALEEFEDTIAKTVTGNIFDRHLKRIFY
jgi:hypothetical protein